MKNSEKIHEQTRAFLLVTDFFLVLETVFLAELWLGKTGPFREERRWRNRRRCNTFGGYCKFWRTESREWTGKWVESCCLWWADLQRPEQQPRDEETSVRQLRRLDPQFKLSRPPQIVGAWENATTHPLDVTGATRSLKWNHFGNQITCFLFHNDFVKSFCFQLK